MSYSFCSFPRPQTEPGSGFWLHTAYCESELMSEALAGRGGPLSAVWKWELAVLLSCQPILNEATILWIPLMSEPWTPAHWGHWRSGS